MDDFYEHMNVPYIYILYSIEIAFSYVQSQVHMIFIEETCFQFYISNLYGWFFARLRPLQPKTHMIFVNVQQCRSYINVYTLHIAYMLVFFGRVHKISFTICIERIMWICCI